MENNFKKFVLIVMFAGAVISLAVFATVKTTTDSTETKKEVIKSEIEKEAEIQKETKEEMRKNFVSGCIDGNIDQYDFCNCAFEDIYNKMGAEEFMTEAVKYALNEEFSPKMLDIVSESAVKCLE